MGRRGRPSAPCPRRGGRGPRRPRPVTFAGYGGAQPANVTAIVDAGAAEELDACGPIGVMTAMGESLPRVLDRGDDVGPDQRGSFQQRDNGAWGSCTDRMDLTTSAVDVVRRGGTSP